DALAAIVWRLSSREIAARRTAAAALGRLGQKATPAIPALLKAAVDPETAVRKAACVALYEVDPAWNTNEAARQAVPLLIVELASWYPEVRVQSAELLARIGAAAVPDLAAALGEYGD